VKGTWCPGVKSERQIKQIKENKKTKETRKHFAATKRNSNVRW
jgi:hypothetical protein